jgi:tetratricopeptide (TPR) repeat protein
MPDENLLQQAIAAARAGRELSARELFLRIVQAEPQNEVAWMWLTGLLDNIDERVYACQKVLDINPGNVRARQYLSGLLVEQQKALDEKKASTEAQLAQAQVFVETNKQDEALSLLQELTADDESSAEALNLLAELTPDLEERARIYEKALALTPQDARTRKELQQLRYFLKNPFELATMYEEQGDFEKALAIYRRAALKTESNPQWDAIYHKITRLENLKQEKIARVSPTISIARLTAGPPLLYLSLMFIQVGINPLADPQPLLWLGFLWVLVGGFFVALTSVRSRHRVWSLIFGDVNSAGTPKSRLVLSAAGWALILLPHLLLVAEAVYRLLNTKIPVIR